jgi:ankyrin repeat protein
VRVTAALALAAALGAAAVAADEHPAIARAERAVARGDVDPERDLGPLVQALELAQTAERKRELVGAIVDLGRVDAPTPNAVKSFLRDRGAPVLLEVARTGDDPFLQGDALYALREMRAPRPVLERAAAIAEADPDPFVQSRGEILRNWLAGQPAEDPAAAAGAPADAAKAQAAIAYLDKRGIAVSTQALRDAARRADPEVVRALLDAGIAADTGVAAGEETPLELALSIGCTSQGEETDWLVETVQLLVAAGADVDRRDDNANTPLVHAVHWCKGTRIVALLVDAGAEVSAKNGSGLSAFGLAIVTGKLDAAEVLVGKGARVDAAEKAMLDASARDARAKQLVARAAARR